MEPNRKATDRKKEAKHTANKGVLSAITSAFQTNKPALKSYISRFLLSRDDIEDVSQETFLRAYKAEQQKARDAQSIDQPKAFLFRVAKNLILTEFSKKSRKITDYIEDFETPEHLLESESLEASVMAQQKLGIYCEAVANLPKQCRQVVLLKKVYGLSNKDIAKKMGLSVSTVEKHLAKGIRDTQKSMAKHYQDSDNGSVSKPSKRA